VSFRPFLLLQLRPEDIAADDEYQAFLRSTGLDTEQLVRLRMDQGFPDINLDDYSGIIVGGGPSNVSSADDKKYDYQKMFEPKLKGLLQRIIDRDFPYFGECYGLGILASVLGGHVGVEKYHEDVGAVTVRLSDEGEQDALTNGLPDEFRAFAGHKEACQEVPPNAALLASTDTCPVHMIRIGQNVYATQFHPELDSYGLEVRINVYRHAGYFPPEDADKLIAMGHKEIVTVPAEILRRFVERYQR
jgi:GMP synthase (glutamine-hydrolysing)